MVTVNLNKQEEGARLLDICWKAYIEQCFEDIQIMVRTNGPEGYDEDDMLLGYTTVKTMTLGFEVEPNQEGWDLHSRFDKFDIRPDYFKEGIVVWTHGDWVTL